MKKAISLTMAVLLLLSVFAFNVSAQKNVSVYIDGKKIEFDVQPQIINGRTMVPLRVIFEALGATVDWNQDAQTVTSTKGSTTISLTINNPIMYVNGKAVTLDSPACLVSGRTLVPVRAISEAFGTTVDWDNATKTVTITTLDPNGTTTMYAADGRTITIKSSEIEAYKAVGWYTYPVYVADGTIAKPFTALNTNPIDYYKYSSENGKIIFNITGYARGDKAEAIGGLKNAEDGQEWILLKVKISYLEGQNELEYFTVYDLLYNKTGSKYSVYDEEYSFGYSWNKEGDIYNKGIGKFSTFAGGTMEGYVAVLTDESSEMPIVKIPMENGNMFVSTIGAPELTKKTKEETIAENPVLSKCKLILPSVPTTLSNSKTAYANGGYRDVLQSRFTVSDITYEFKESSGGKVDLYIYYKGEKTYDVNGSGQTSDCKIGWKLYDAEGYVLKDGTTYTMGIAMDEKFKDVEETIYSLEPGTYKLVIMGVNGY